MPEGPELALSRDQLRPVLLGKQIINVFTSDKGRYRAKDPPGYGRFLEHLVDGVVFTIAEINVKGKLMWWRLTSPRLDKDWYVWITYGMSGQWVLDGSEPAQHVSCTFLWNDSGNKFDPYQVLRFNDPRHFGTLHFVDDVKQHRRKLASLGPDMLNAPPTDQIFIDQLRKKPDRSLVRALMDQSTVSGVGNYVKAESLYRAALMPTRFVMDCTDAQLVELKKCIEFVMKRSYEYRGATLSTYVNVDGTEGRAQSWFSVYHRTVDPNGNLVQRLETDDDRTTHWVPAVQR